jgi:replicative DNA helicase
MVSSEITSRVLPHDTGAEQAFLGALLIDPDVIDSALDLVRENDFYDRRNTIIFRAMAKLHNDEHKAIDTITISDYFKKHGLTKDSGGVEYLNELLDTTPTSANAKHYADIIRGKALLRGLIKVAGDIAGMSFRAEKDIAVISDHAENMLFEITNRNITQSYVGIQEVIHSSIGNIQKFRDRKGRLIGITTGFRDLDDLTGGLLGGQLFILAGRTSSGKTAFALSMASRIAVKTNLPVLFFSLEMTKDELGLRILCAEAKVSNNRIKHAEFLTQYDMDHLVHAADRLYDTQLIIDDKSNITVNEIRAKARRVQKDKGNLALIIVDYMQLIEGPEGFRREDRYNIISDVSRSLKHMAKELDVPVVALAQLSRNVERREDKHPILSDLRESGSIEQDADIVGFIHRNYIYSKNDAEKNLAELLIRKHRNGPTEDIKLLFQGEYMRFDDIAKGHNE